MGGRLLELVRLRKYDNYNAIPKFKVNVRNKKRRKEDFYALTIETGLATHMFSGQLSGFSIRYPDFKSSNRFSKGTPGYGDPPRKEHLAVKDVTVYR